MNACFFFRIVFYVLECRNMHYNNIRLIEYNQKIDKKGFIQNHNNFSLNHGTNIYTIFIFVMHLFDINLECRSAIRHS